MIYRIKNPLLWRLPCLFLISVGMMLIGARGCKENGGENIVKEFPKDLSLIQPEIAPAAEKDLQSLLSESHVHQIRWEHRTKSPQYMRGLLTDESEFFTPSEVALNFWEDHKNLFGLDGNAGGLEPFKETRDRWGITHLRFRQRQGSLVVHGAGTSVHIDSRGRIFAVSANLSPLPPSFPGPTLTSTEAVNIASMNSLFEGDKKHPFHPRVEESSSELKIYDRGLLGKEIPHDPRQAWQVDFPNGERFFIDSNSGAVLSHTTRFPSGRNREIWDANGGLVPPGGEGAVLTYNESGLVPGATVSGDAADAYNYVGESYDYFFNNFGRDGFSDSSAPGHIEQIAMISYPASCGLRIPGRSRSIDPDMNCGNAFWNGEYMAFCNDMVDDPDVVGHEYTHAVTEYTANLVYEGEPGALNESYSDIFGNMIDRSNWLVGDGVPGGPIRNMEDPPSLSIDAGPPFPPAYPDTYEGTNWMSVTPPCDGSNDVCGVHINSSVPNKAAYLLGSSILHYHNGTPVYGIGRARTEQIYYQTLAFYLTESSTMIQMANDTITVCNAFQAAGSFGITRDDCMQVHNAFVAVHILSPDEDEDGDGLTSAEEAENQTFYDDPDSDDDGLSDQQEVEVSGTDPRDSDSDNDGLSDGDEVGRGTNPLLSDTDGDGLSDGHEVNTYLTNPLVADTDGDGLSDGDEVGRGTGPLDPDSDDDGLLDGDEVGRGTNPLVADTDGDLLSDGDEVGRGTNPLDTDTDDDALTDGQEVLTYSTDPLDADSEDDGLNDGAEVLALNPYGVATDPHDPDSDDDNLTDGQEVNTYASNPMDRNTDDDCLDDGVEVARGLDPTIYQVPVIELDPALVAFGEVNRRGRMVHYTLSNSGDLPLEILNVALTGTGFSMGATPAVVAPGEEFSIPVVFSPPGIGDETGQVTFETNDCFHTPVSLPLSASGLISRLAASPTSINFEQSPIWDRIFRSLNLTNPDSNRPLKLTLTTDDPAFWPARLTAEVSPGETVQVPIYFRPYRYGAFEEKLLVKGFYGQDSQLIEIPLSGFGEGDSPEIAVEPGSIDLGEVDVGESATSEITVTNEGSGRLYVHRVEVLGEDGNPLEIVLPLLERFTVAPGRERTLRIRFSPQNGGAVRGVLRLHHNAPPGEGTITIPFEGSGG